MPIRRRPADRVSSRRAVAGPRLAAVVASLLGSGVVLYTALGLTYWWPQALVLVVFFSAIPGLEGLHPYLLTQQYFAWQGLLRTPTDWAPITHSLWVCALYAVPALVAGYLVFLRRDVAGG